VYIVITHDSNFNILQFGSSINVFKNKVKPCDTSDASRFIKLNDSYIKQEQQNNIVKNGTINEL